jgi:hypothetical protein
MSSSLRYAVFSFVHHISKVSGPNSTLVSCAEINMLLDFENEVLGQFLR